MKREDFVPAEVCVGVLADQRSARSTQLPGGIDQLPHRLPRARMDLATRPGWPFYPLGRIRSQESAPDGAAAAFLRQHDAEQNQRVVHCLRSHRRAGFIREALNLVIADHGAPHATEAGLQLLADQ